MDALGWTLKNFISLEDEATDLTSDLRFIDAKTDALLYKLHAPDLDTEGPFVEKLLSCTQNRPAFVAEALASFKPHRVRVPRSSRLRKRALGLLARLLGKKQPAGV
jgi:hypothetical protein